jgi:hypothetical protein
LGIKLVCQSEGRRQVENVGEQSIEGPEEIM